MYGKINKDGRLEIYDKPYVKIGSTLIANPDDRIMASAGYKPLICGRAPDVAPDEILEIRYVEKDSFIDTVYTIVGG